MNLSEEIFQSYIKVLKEYTGLSEHEMIKKSMALEEFNNQFTSEIIKDPAKIKQIYEQSDFYMFRNPYYYRHNLEARLITFWEPIVANPGSVLDYGCGAGILSELLLRKGVKDLTLCDLPSRTFEFVKFFFSNRTKYEIDVDSLKGKYDWIISNSVLEHIPNPIRVINMWKEHLTQRGKIIDSMAVDIGGPHLAQSISMHKETRELIEKINSRNI